MKERMKMLCSADGGNDLVKDYATFVLSCRQYPFFLISKGPTDQLTSNTVCNWTLIFKQVLYFTCSLLSG